MGIPTAILRLSVSILILVVASVIAAASYIALSHPSVNHLVKEGEKEQERLFTQHAYQKHQDWTFDEYSDVRVSEDSKYPLVVLRTGFKAIKKDEGTGTITIGWAYDIANVSASDYTASVTYILQDFDQFDIASSEASAYAKGNSVTTVRGVITLSDNDLLRVGSTSWGISLSPQWKDYRSDRARYQLLTELIASGGAPWWVLKKANNDELAVLANNSAKWSAIAEGVELLKNQ